MGRDILLYRSEGLADAWLLHARLADAGIPSRVAGESLAGLAGAIPVKDTKPTVWVDEGRWDEAQAVLARFQGPELVHPAWVCPGCGEDNPAGFAVCWNCEAPAG